MYDNNGHIVSHTHLFFCSISVFSWYLFPQNSEALALDFVSSDTTTTTTTSSTFLYAETSNIWVQYMKSSALDNYYETSWKDAYAMEWVKIKSQYYAKNSTS